MAELHKEIRIIRGTRTSIICFLYAKNIEIIGARVIDCMLVASDNSIASVPNLLSELFKAHGVNLAEGHAENKYGRNYGVTV